jgi:hypothetical protein
LVTNTSSYCSPVVPVTCIIDISRREIIDKYATYAQAVEDREGPRPRSLLVKPVLGLFTGEPNGRLFRVHLDTGLRNKDRRIGDVIRFAAECLWDETLDHRATSPPPPPRQPYIHTYNRDDDENNTNRGDSDAPRDDSIDIEAGTDTVTATPQLPVQVEVKQ